MSSLLALLRWSVALVVLASACGRAEVTDPSSSAAPGHRALVAAGATLLDVRSAAEYAGGHLEGALLIPVQELEARISEVPRGRPVVVYCRSGGRSARAASMLRTAGYDVHDLGAMDAW